MKITTISTDGIGPLDRVEWNPGSCEVLYDDNQQGKTTLIDVIINSLFKGRSKIFKSRYESYEGCRVEVDMDGSSYRFGEDGDTDGMGELLDWDMPELHRFLCIRASDLSLSRPLQNKGPEEIWKALSSVMSGLDQDYLDGIQKTLRKKAQVTTTMNWRNREPEGLKDRMNKEIAPNLDRAERAEDRLRDLMDCRRRRREARSDRETYREKLKTIEDELESIERRRARAELDRADELLAEIRSLNNDVEDRFGDRIDKSFLEPWEDSIAEKSKIGDALSDWEEARDLRDQVNELDERLEEIESELEEIRSTFTSKKEEFVETRREEIRPLYHRWSEAVASRDQWLPILEWATPGMGLSVSLVVVGLGLYFVEMMPGLIVGGFGLLGLVAMVTGVFYRRRLERTIERTRREARERAGDWPGISAESDEALLETLMDVSPDEVFPDLHESVQELESERQTIEGEKSAVVESLEETLEDLDAEVDVEDADAIERQVEQLRGELEDVNSDLEAKRRKTGVPDLETFREALGERSDIEDTIEQKRVKLTTLLDLEDDENLGVIRSTVERQLEDYNDVSADADPEELEKKETELKDQARQIEKDIERAEDTIESAESTERTISSELSEIGIPFERPEELFRKEHEWEQQLEEALMDRLAGALGSTVIDEMEGDYLSEIQRLLESDSDSEWTINHLYRSVMGEEQTVSFDEDEMVFEIHTDDAVITEHELSSGARSHLYFSCRLSVLRHLFPDQPGFMILDDPFLHYFPERKESVVRALKPLVEEGWQILLFTVDPASRDLFSEHLSAGVTSIDDLRVTES
jgi:DNA repair exonuclease SbcCD ATPase subunit